jgi:hypothetical protein
LGTVPAPTLNEPVDFPSPDIQIHMLFVNRFRYNLDILKEVQVAKALKTSPEGFCVHHLLLIDFYFTTDDFIQSLIIT